MDFWGDTDYVADPLVVQSPSAHEIVVVLRRGAAISGTVVDEVGRALGEVSVTCYPAGTRLYEDEWPDGVVESYTDEAGHFRARGLEPGRRYLVLAEGDAPHGMDLRRDVAVGSSDIGLVVRRGRRVAGRLLDASGVPVIEATLMVFDDDGELRAWYSTGYDGKFDLHGVPTSAARVSARLLDTVSDLPLGVLPEDVETIELRLDIRVPRDE